MGYNDIRKQHNLEHNRVQVSNNIKILCIQKHNSEEHVTLDVLINISLGNYMTQCYIIFVHYYNSKYLCIMPDAGL